MANENNQANSTMIERMIAVVINNIQVKISNIHIRYEDCITTGRPFSFGVTLKDLETYTTDLNWERGFAGSDVRCVFKVAELNSLSLYMNCNAILYTQTKIDDMPNLFRNHIAQKNSAPLHYTFILNPISSMAKLKLNMNPENGHPPYQSPKIDLFLEMDGIGIALTNKQFQYVLKLGDYINRLQLGAPYRKYRPFNKPYKNNYKEWWKFAITAVLEVQIKKRNRYWTWEHIHEHRQLCANYSKSYKQKSLTSRPSSELVETCSVLEKKLDLFNIILIRKRIQIDTEKQKKEEEETKVVAKSGWFGGWFGGGNKDDDDKEPKNFVKSLEDAMSSEEKNQLYETIGYTDNFVPLEIPKYYEAVKLNFRLTAFELGLYKELNSSKEDLSGSILETLMLLHVSMATCNVRQRPASGGLSVTAGVKELNIIGLKRDDFIPTLITSKVTEELNLLDVLFEIAPIDELCDQRVNVLARPLQIVYDAETILKLLKEFKPPKSVNLSELEGAASVRMADFKERSATGMQYMLDQHKIMELDIKFLPNIIIIPETGTYIPNSKSLIVISMGDVHITSQPRRSSKYDVHALSQSGADQDKIMEVVLAHSYDNYKVLLQSMQILVVKEEEDWESVLEMAASSDMHVLLPTSIVVKASVCLFHDDPRLPKTKVEILLPGINIDVSEDRVFEALGIFKSLPMPDEDIEAKPLLKAVSTASLQSVSSFLNAESRKKKPIRVNAPQVKDDLVQSTDLVVNFALKEFRVVLYKSNTSSIASRSESTHFGTPPEEPSTDDMEVFADAYTIQSVSRLQKILALEILQLECDMTQLTYEMTVNAKLGAIKLTQFSNENYKLIEYPVIDTPQFSEELTYLLTVSFTSVNKKSPEFSTKHNSTEAKVTVNFSTLKVLLHLECLLKLMEINNSLQKRLEAYDDGKPKDRIATAGEPAPIPNKLDTIAEDSEEVGTKIVTERTKKSRSRKVVDSIKMHIVANLHQVVVMLSSRTRGLATLKVENFTAGVVMKSSYTEVKVGLKDIHVEDLNPHTIHTSILSIVGKNALKCQLVLFNLDETSAYNSDDMKVNVEIGGMRIVFLNWFVTSVLNFIHNFQAAEQAIANVSAAAAEQAKNNALDAYEKATRIKLNIKIKAPIIVVPVNSKSTDAIVLDLGYLLLSNTTSELEVNNDERSPAVLDDIKLEMRSMKVYKASVVDEYGKASIISIFPTHDDVDATYGVKTGINILDPVSFTLDVKRNLSFSWYKELPEINLAGRLKSITLNLFKDDYTLVMSILNQNMTEGQNEIVDNDDDIEPSVTTVEVHKPNESPSHKSTAPTDNAKRVLDIPKIYAQLMFNFQFDGVQAALHFDNGDSLAEFGIYFLSVKGKKLIDGTLSTSIVLCNIQLDDKRKNTKSKITRYLGRKNWKHEDPHVFPSECDENNRSYMVDVTAIIREADSVAEVRVSSFDLILCIDFLLKLSHFFELPEESKNVQPIAEVKPGVVAKQTAVPVKENDIYKENKVSLMIHIDQPDIILIESLENINTSAIIFNMEANLNYRAIGEKQIINGEIQSLKMYLCSFKPERREATKHYIIHPCVITLQGSTPEHEGLHISLKLSEIIINISPATIELINKALKTLQTDNAEKNALKIEKPDYTDIWEQKPFKKKNYWFFKPDTAVEALEITENEIRIPKTEKCVVEVPCITIVLEMGIGYYTTPLISLDMRLQAVVSDWSSALRVNGSLCLNMDYYNQSFGAWEPIIELNEHIKPDGELEYLPWDLSFSMKIENKSNESEESIEDAKIITVQSEQNLELTVTKTLLNLIPSLNEAFAQAMDVTGLTKPDIIAPYVVENDTGFNITINFRRGIFTLHECHTPRATKPNISAVLYQTESIDNNFSLNEIKDCTISPNGRVYLQTKDLSTLTTEEDEEYNLYVKIGGIEKEILLPVIKSDTRYFALYKDVHQDPWGLISEVKSEYGTTKINIHGVVSVFNHFSIPLQVHRTKPNSVDKSFIGEIQPHDVFHIPLHGIYSETKELFFCLQGYKCSVQGIKWNDCPTDLNYSRQIQCDPLNTFEPFYMNAVREKTEVFYENTNKYKLLSAYYTIHLRPPLYMHNSLPINIKVSVLGCNVANSSRSSQASPIIENYKEKSIMKQDLLDYGEKEVKPGDVLHLPTLKFSGKKRDNSSFLIVKLMDYLEKDWSCTTSISDQNIKDIAIWKFTAFDSPSKMEIDLCVRYETLHDSLVATIFSPFWLVNKSGLMLSYNLNTETVDVLFHPPEYKGPILFSPAKSLFDKKAISVRVDSGDWSDKIPLDIAGSNGTVTCTCPDEKYQIGVHNSLTTNSLTKQITFIPFYNAVNNCDFEIELQELNRPADNWNKVAPGSCSAIWPKSGSDFLMVAKVNGITTVPFNYAEAQCCLLQLYKDKVGGINVDVQATEGGVYIIFTQYNPGDAPALFINHTNDNVAFYEKTLQNKIITVSPLSLLLFTWANPAGEKNIVMGKNEVVSDLRRDDCGEIKLHNNTTTYWVSFLDGLQRVILFTKNKSIVSRSETSAQLQTITQSIMLRLQGIGLSVINNEKGVDIMYMGIKSSGIIWESKKDKKRFKQMNIDETAQVEGQYQKYLLEKSVNQESQYFLDIKQEIDFENMVLKTTPPRIIQRTFYPGIWVNMNTSPFQTQLHVKLNKIQMDNQLRDCIFPVVLTAVPPPKSVAKTITLKPFIECSIVERIIPNSTVKQYKYAIILIQEFHLKVDLVFLAAIAELFTTDLNDEQRAKLFNADVDAISKPLWELVQTRSLEQQKHFYDNLHLGPLKIHLSFSMAGSDTIPLPGVLATLVQGIGVTLTDVNDVVFRLAFFEREFQFFTQQQLTSEITTHYAGQGLKQLYVLVLGLDVLGNPYGLVVGLKKGVGDLFYEPFQGAIQGPGEFAEGLVLGVKSLFGHTVGGAAGAVSKITGALGKGIASLTFDEDYQKKRQRNINKKPENFQQGIARSGKGLVMGFVDGVTGVVTKPVAGAKEEGVEGFFKGLGKGAIGLVTRPTAGVVDFASDSFGAVKRAAESKEDDKRLRAPRFIRLDAVLRPYCRAEAKGNQIFREIEKGKYATTDTYVHREVIIRKKENLIISNHRVIYITKNDLFGHWVVNWQHLWPEIEKITASDRGVELVMKRDNKKVMGIFGRSDKQNRLLIKIPPNRREKLVEIMESQRLEDI
ncbi:vacuolar protein sorting-associated protein 13 [Teleopsis dalmanni]|uniref:vacuolar protein sorting-associated protein 13 n=1 Tax=Teleopsis dalmanni TaxID=139649 RepID=UPI0018CF2F27|nr:vacuolar protein sorting-associated protein 13 [Teleopsis dalmanni]